MKFWNSEEANFGAAEFGKWPENEILKFGRGPFLGQAPNEPRQTQGPRKRPEFPKKKPYRPAKKWRARGPQVGRPTAGQKSRENSGKTGGLGGGSAIHSRPAGRWADSPAGPARKLGPREFLIREIISIWGK